MSVILYFFRLASLWIHFIISRHMHLLKMSSSLIFVQYSTKIFCIVQSYNVAQDMFTNKSKYLHFPIIRSQKYINLSSVISVSLFYLIFNHLDVLYKFPSFNLLVKTLKVLNYEDLGKTILSIQYTKYNY